MDQESYQLVRGVVLGVARNTPCPQIVERATTLYHTLKQKNTLSKEMKKDIEYLLADYEDDLQSYESEEDSEMEELTEKIPQVRNLLKPNKKVTNIKS